MFFLLATTAAALSISNLSNYMIRKYGESYGYINLVKSKRVGLRQLINTILCVAPLVNIAYSTYCIYSLYDISKNTKYSNYSFNNTGSVKKSSKEKKLIDKVFKYTHNKKILKEQLILDGANSERIDKELKKVDDDNKYIIKSKENKKYRKLKAMSNAELWLESITCDMNLTEKEKLKLYRKYIKDFYQENKQRNPKAIKKTLKLSKKKF